MKSNMVPMNPDEDEDDMKLYEDYSPDYSHNVKISDPKIVVEELNKKVHGQYDAKRTLSLAVQNIQHRMDYPEIELKKGNVLLIGPTGSGKTYLIDTLSNIINMPITKGQMTSMTSMGYVGNSIENLFSKFKIDEENDTDLFKMLYYDRAIEYHNGVPFHLNTKNTIVYLDEIDKIAQGGELGFSEGLQNELIGYLEDGEIYKRLLPTKDMLFIASGAFSGLEDIISRRVNNRGVMGFKKDEDVHKEYEELFSQVIPEDLIEYGFKPEMIARFPNITYNKELTQKDIISILTMPTSHLSKHKEILLKAHDIKIYLPKESRKLIADYVIAKKENGRGIERAVNLLTQEYFFETSRYVGQKILVSPTRVKDILKL